jgi:hypothetical protein
VANREGVPLEEIAMTTRPTSSANFYINSLDKSDNQGSGDFTISKNQNLFSGFFNRIAVNEIVLDWGIPNVASYWDNDTFSVTVSGGINGTFAVTLPNGFYTVEQALDQIVLLLNLQIGSTVFDLGTFGYTVTLEIPGGGSDFVINLTNLSRSLFASASIGTAPGPAFPVSSPKILGTTYIDIVSENLTYNQKLRDATTNFQNRDVLYRWYFSFDNVPIPFDAYFSPILQGYDPFVSRRTPPVVKQIRWSEAQPIGQVNFKVFDDKGRIIDTVNYPSGANFQFQISCLLSEE